MAKPTKATEREMTIQGIIRPEDWDDDDNVSAVSLLTDDDEVIFIAGNDKGRELLDLVDAAVSLKGMVHEEDGEAYMRVTQVTVLEEGGWEEDLDEEED